ncbi:MAG: 16S rRNA (cytosine(1402)-N(4))-methyltransferase RsmH [Saprospiraceae bacterium]|nr:16S rRNA (cytosine(1402)-N(4))-methyltransferase RsmH [Saprospiraceae bacterium]MDW8484265.1 16S rRNA (cytosine(1402)-N(4))-methyltransferase RsmH [Saprospiraceae bacterium]
MMSTYHAPALVKEALEALQIRPKGIYVDATFGGGGHARALLAQLDKDGRLYAFDQDTQAEAQAQQVPFIRFAGFRFIRANFRHLKRHLRAWGVLPGQVDGILADLGISSHQLDTAERGFSFRFDGPLDMRMNPAEERTAADWLNESPEDLLQVIFSRYGEVRNARTLARLCVQFRQSTPFRTTRDLVYACDQALLSLPGVERTRYLAQVFQAVRIAVNDEIGALKDFLREATELLKPGGRLVVISYHSLEDRIVKNWLKTGDAEGLMTSDFYGNIHRPFHVVTRKPIEPSEEEILHNPRVRSAKMRVGERLNTKGEKASPAHLPVEKRHPQ